MGSLQARSERSKGERKQLRFVRPSKGTRGGRIVNYIPSKEAGCFWRDSGAWGGGGDAPRSGEGASIFSDRKKRGA